MTDFVQLWVYLSATPLFGLTATLVTYAVASAGYDRLGRTPWANPVLWSVLCLGAALVATGTLYPSYFAGAQFVHVLLGPAVVALAWPLWQRRAEVRRRRLALAVAALFGGLAAGGSAVAIGWGLGAARALQVDADAGAYAGIALDLQVLLASLLIPLLFRCFAVSVEAQRARATCRSRGFPGGRWRSALAENRSRWVIHRPHPALSRTREREQCRASPPAGGRGSNLRLPLPLSGEGWGEGVRVPPRICSHAAGTPARPSCASFADPRATTHPAGISAHEACIWIPYDSRPQTLGASAASIRKNWHQPSSIEPGPNT